MHFPPCFRFPLFSKNFPTLRKIFKILHTICVFRFPPYFDHDAFMHHPMQVLDAPAIEQSSITLTLWSGQVLDGIFWMCMYFRLGNLNAPFITT